MARVKSVEYFRVPPRWLVVKLTDESGGVGWGEAPLEGHTQIDIALWDLKARNLGGPIYQLLGGKLRSKLKVYAWIGGDRPDDVEIQAQRRQDRDFKAVKMNATEDIGWLDSPSSLDSCVSRLQAVKNLGMDADIDFHGRIHKAMAKQLTKLLEPHRPLFIEEPLLSEKIDGIKDLSRNTTTLIALGERLHSRWDVKPYLESGAVDILQPDVCHDLTSYTKNPDAWDVRDGYIELTGTGLGIEIDAE
ncbi:related to starvation sensing protein rspA [Rhynchosporium graminicola]|uniref:Related to starvation sensing protein rspA n=1 Tax=Rhynchosporium graminicola TaxID=2792576 RepID=A0A1E1KPH4_9HELO|nr:related to starvation sensing protein rspA [Rhynchosporium commune]